MSNKKTLFNNLKNLPNNIEIRFVNEWAEEDLVSLYKSGGWWKEHYDSSGLTALLKGSFAFAVAVHLPSGVAIGMGRAISDGVSDAYIQDLVVLPECRGKGIGAKLVKSLVEYCKDKGIMWIGLIAEPDQDRFYSTIGFKQMKNYIPMKYEE